ncbi:HET domain-containing protein [Fusarium falciforme]|uniref:HET domain-containing protein n=1 Tax=Fusarium falciforme TaxID=195108 RepID=UPI0022FFFDCA|nr:HET domain-containing protein [Fusarium falciforme]WAO89975.1 HET domain-containing protein [Fusarium falciforme]
MAIIEDFPPFKLCALCKGIFPRADDPNVDDNIQGQIWTNDEGYHFTRTREEIERGAIEGCEFCTDIVQNDGAYKESSPDRQHETIGQEDDYERSTYGSDEESEQDSEVGSQSAEPDAGPDYIAMFSGLRAGCFPPMEERLEFRIKFHSEDKSLAIYDSNGLLIGHNPASKLTHAQATLAEFGPDQTFGAVRQWLGECVDNHPGCPGDAPRELPTRLIMVSPLGVDVSARFCETLGQTVQYCALSYCWGGDRVHKTTRERYAAYLQELPYEELPQTIRDAFQVARDGFLKRLSANDTGLFFLPIRVDKSTKGSVLMSKEGPYWAMIGAYPQPINDRAWTLQEAMLTPRLLIFTGMDFIWKCQAGFGPATAEHPRTANEIHIENLYGPPNESRWFPALVDCGYNFISTKQ